MANARADSSSPELARAGDAPRAWRLDDIIDARKLAVQLEAAALDNLSEGDVARARAKDLLHSALFRGRLIAQERLQQGADGLDTARLLAAVQDVVLRAMFDFAARHVAPPDVAPEETKLSLFATGGYGRGVLAPSSDVDLLFLRPRSGSAPWVGQIIEYMLYLLWDMGLKVGHAVRTPEECVRLSQRDLTIKTSFMDARLVAGDAALAADIRERFDRNVIRGRDSEFIAGKLAERDARHERQGGSRYVVEPNVKDGKGGLRDLQTLYWIVKHIHGGDSLEDILATGVFTPHERRLFMRAGRFFWTVRCHLHYLTGRAEERLSFDFQPELAKRLGYRDRNGRLGVERFMKRYFIAAKDVGGLTRILLAKLEADQARSAGLRWFWPGANAQKLQTAEAFAVDNGRLTIAEPDLFERDPSRMLRLFTLARDQNLPVHPDALAAAARAEKRFTEEARRKPEARDAFFDALLNGNRPAETLAAMNEAGVLGRFLPEFGGIVAQTQFNMYHHYTVDEHSLRAVAAISDIEHGRGDFPPLLTEIFSEIDNRRALYLAMLLHDTGKGQGDQQVEGAKTARAACERLGLPEAETDLVAWLVGHHLVMSDTAQKRDITDPRTVSGFASVVGSLERLRLLFILTAADISAVGPNMWNGWKRQLLSDLYHTTVAALRGGRADEASIDAAFQDRAEERQSELIDRLGGAPEVMLALDQTYWASFDVDALAWHAACLSTGGDATAACKLTEDGQGLTLVASGRDRVGLFADLAAAIASEGGEIVSAQAYTSPGGHVLDVFAVESEHGGVFGGGAPERLRQLETVVRGALTGESDVQAPSRRANRRQAAFLVEPSVRFLAAASAAHTVIDIEARDRPALLYDVAKTLSTAGVSIHSAHVGSYGERVFDAFYVTGPDDQKIEAPAEKAALREKLLEAVRREEPEAPASPIRRLARSPAADSF